jgi:monothiol glutaredoxin
VQTHDEQIALRTIAGQIIGSGRRNLSFGAESISTVILQVAEVANVDVIERIKSQLAANPVLLFMKGTPDFPQCGFSATAVRALGEVGATFGHVNIFEDPELREALKQYSNWPTYPQLYVNGELVGGSDIIVEMYKSGELAKLVSGAGATTA